LAHFGKWAAPAPVTASTLDVGAALPNPSGLINSEDDTNINVQSILCDEVQDDQDDSYLIHEMSNNLPYVNITKQIAGNIYTEPDYVEPEILACAAHLDIPPTFAPWTTKVTLDGIEFAALLDTGASADLMRPDVADKLKLHRHQCATLRTLSLADRSTHKCNQYVIDDFNLSEVDIDSQPRKFFVADMPVGKHEIILGMPFVRDFRLSPDWQDDVPWPLLNVHINGNASTIWTSQLCRFQEAKRLRHHFIN
jgi:Aspartyl protease